jgi:hypothetical protein
MFSSDVIQQPHHDINLSRRHWCSTIEISRVDTGVLLQQQLDNDLASIRGGPPQRCLALIIIRVSLGSMLKQQLDAGLMSCGLGIFMITSTVSHTR